MVINMRRNGLIGGVFFIWPVLNYLDIVMARSGGLRIINLRDQRNK